MPLLPKSLPRICVALGFQDPNQLSRAAENEYKEGSSFLEFRLDHLTHPAVGIDLIRDFRARYPEIYILATCRHASNHGSFSGSVDQQVNILKDAGAAGAIAADLEIESAEVLKGAVNALRERTPLIVSYHNFATTVALEAVKRRLQRLPADAYKLVTTARKPSDSLSILEFAKNGFGSTPFTVFAMSEVGLPTRILAPGYGSLYTYAAPIGSAGTAPGQISGAMMRNLYRCEKLSRQTKIYGVIAEPVAHSKSPFIHNRAFHSRRIDAVYLPFLVSPARLADWMKTASTLPVCGFSVTIPHKQRIIRHLDTVDPLAKRIGAVNTVWRKAGKWRGSNTDVDGVLKPLSSHTRLPKVSVLIAGYGGAARAAAIALCDAGARVTITGRNLQAAEKLGKAIRGNAIPLEQAAGARFDVLVHATPVGMSPRSSECLFPDSIPADIVLDMVYNPHETELLKRAAAQGSKIIYGSEMLLAQAARQFEIWTGESAPLAVMSKALEAQFEPR